MQEHVVVAMVGALPAKVECAECPQQHLSRAAPPGAKVKAAAGGARTRRPVGEATTRAALASAPKVDLVALTAGRPARGYDPRTTYAKDDVVRHPSFGVGVVMVLPGP